MTDKDGMIETTYRVAEDAKIICDDKECSLNNLFKNCWVTVTTEKRGDAEVIIKIKAKRPEKTLLLSMWNCRSEHKPIPPFSIRKGCVC